jgi:hypothetical protein
VASQNKRLPLDRVRWLPAINNSGSLTIPAFGLVKLVSVSDEGVLTVDRPDADGQDVYVNGPFAVAAGGHGMVTRDWPAYALYDAGDGTPAPGETWGAGASSYKLRKDKGGLTIQGGALGGNVLVSPIGSGGSGDGSGGSGGGGSFTPSGARVYHNTSQVLGGGTYLSFNSERWDDAAFHDNSTNNSRLTVPATGRYLVGFSVFFAPASVGLGYGAHVWLNRASIVGGQKDFSDTVLDQMAISAECVWDATAGDYFEVRLSADSGTTVFGSDSTNRWYCEFWVQRVG